MVDFVKDSTSDFIAGIKDHLDEAAAQVIGGGSGAVTNEASDKEVDRITKAVIQSVKGAKDYGISTAAFIDGKFRLVSDFDIDSAMEKKLEQSAKKLGSVKESLDEAAKSKLHFFVPSKFESDLKSKLKELGIKFNFYPKASGGDKTSFLFQSGSDFSDAKTLARGLTKDQVTESTKYEQFTDSYTRVDETVSTTAGAYRNIDGSLFETKDAANIAMGELGLSETHRIAPRRPNDVLEYVLVPNSVKRVDEAKSKEASAVLKLMDADEDGDYQKALAAVLKANPHADKKKLEKELDKYI